MTLPTTQEAWNEMQDDLAREAEPYNAFYEADRELHYLWTAGYSTYCGCAACESACEAEYERMEADYRFDYEATIAEIDDTAAYLFDRAEAAREAELNPPPPAAVDDPWF